MKRFVLTAMMLSACNYVGPLTPQPYNNGYGAYYGGSSGESTPSGGNNRTPEPTSVPTLEPLVALQTACPNGTTNDKLDVLFVFDNSGSMQNTQDAMKAEAARFIVRLTETQIDYRIALTTTDLDDDKAALLKSGNIKVIHKGEPLETAKQFWRLLDLLSTHGSASEMGFGAALVALSTASVTVSEAFAGPRVIPGAADSDFLRADARTLVVIISDEDDSTEWSADTVLKLKALRTKPEDLRFVAVVDPSPGPAQGCESSSSMEGTPVYHAYADSLNKQAQIIDYCSQFADTIDLVSVRAKEQSCEIVTPDAQD